MTGRPAGLAAEPPPPAPVLEPAISPRDELGERYAAELLAAFRAIHETSGHVVTHLEGSGSPKVFLAQVAEFDAIVKVAGCTASGVSRITAPATRAMRIATDMLATEPRCAAGHRVPVGLRSGFARCRSLYGQAPFSCIPQLEDASLIRATLPLLLALVAPLLLTAVPASATPGMLNARGCHGHPRHCHPRSEWRTNRRGRHYIAGRFFHD